MAEPDDSPESLKQMAAEEGFLFPFCYDETQAVAKRYSAACTPDFFLYNAAFELAYRGQLDDSRPGNGKPLTGKDLRKIITANLQRGGGILSWGGLTAKARCTSAAAAPR